MKSKITPDLKLLADIANTKVNEEDNKVFSLADIILHTYEAELNKKSRQKEEYGYIPLPSSILIFIGYFIYELNKIYEKPNKNKYELSNKYNLFIDLGAGNGATKLISIFSHVYHYIGVEKYPIKNYNKSFIKKEDFLKIKTFEDIRTNSSFIIGKNNNIIFYAYNPLKDPLTMYMALMFWIDKVLVSGDILIYVRTSIFTNEQEKNFRSLFTKLIEYKQVYVYIKP